jgi:hypothetical protein
VTDLIQDRNVLDKKFYVVIPANALEMGFLSAQSVLPGVKNPDISSIERSVILEKAKTILEPKRDHLVGQFARIGLYARQLTTQEIIQLYYNRYNPEASEGQKITDSRAYTTPIVEARIQGVTMTDMSQTNTQTPTAPAAAAQEGGNQPPTPTGPATQGTPMPGASTTPTTTPTPAAPTAPAAPGAEKPQMPADKAAEVISGGPAINPTAPAMPGASAAPAATPPPSMGGAASTTPAAPAVPDADAQAAIDSTLQEIGGKTPSVGATTPTTTPAPAMGGAAPSQTPTPAAGSTGVSVPPQSKVSVSGNGGTTDQAGGDQKANAALPPLPEI